VCERERVRAHYIAYGSGYHGTGSCDGLLVCMSPCKWGAAAAAAAATSGVSVHVPLHPR
jgi:hypothetical protein